ncbi:hypothetical protein LINGRAHAP2_LOCUS25017 [Linum grandiflorum]
MLLRPSSSYYLHFGCWSLNLVLARILSGKKVLKLQLTCP